MAAYLEPGEAAVIRLALDHGIRLVSIDEHRGQLVARTFGFHVTGRIGRLLRAKKEGLVPAVRPCIDAMRHRGVRLAERPRVAALLVDFPNPWGPKRDGYP